VRRLQQECEHQLDMEKGKSFDVDRQKTALEERLEEANARAAAVERAFHGRELTWDGGSGFRWIRWRVGFCRNRTDSGQPRRVVFGHILQSVWAF